MNNMKYFNKSIYSPCDDTVHKVVDGIENNAPFSCDFTYNVGNSVVLKVGSYYIVIGHFQKVRLLVKEGELAEQQLAIIGKSGLTPRPHLHMQVSKCKDVF